MWRKAFQKKMPNRAEIRFTTKTIVTSLSRDIYPDSSKNKIMTKFSLGVIHVSPCVTCHNGFTIKTDLFKYKRFKDGGCAY